MWGCNPDCRLMIEDAENRSIPSLTLLENLKRNSADSEQYEPFHISLGVTHSAVVTRNGELYTSGSKLEGQLGVKFAK